MVPVSIIHLFYIETVLASLTGLRQGKARLSFVLSEIDFFSINRAIYLPSEHGMKLQISHP